MTRLQIGLWIVVLVVFIFDLCHAECISNFQEIYDQEETLATEDISIPRRYVICPDQFYNIGYLDFDNNLQNPQLVDEAVDANNVVTINPPIPLRPNIILQCGDDGKIENLCWIIGGDIQMDGTATRNIITPTVDNILVEGFVFLSARQHSLLVTKPGDITFRNCEWRDFTRSKVPIMLDYFDSFSSDSLLVTFQDCSFQENRYFGEESYSALIFGNSNQNKLLIERTIFKENDMVWNNTQNSTNSFLIETLGPTCIDRSCFMDNLIGTAPVAVFGTRFESSQAYVSNSSGTVCNFASSFQSILQLKSFAPFCIGAMEETCNFNFNATERPCTWLTAPTPSPTNSPTPVPSNTITSVNNNNTIDSIVNTTTLFPDINITYSNDTKKSNITSSP